MERFFVTVFVIVAGATLISVADCLTGWNPSRPWPAYAVHQAITMIVGALIVWAAR